LKQVSIANRRTYWAMEIAGDYEPPVDYGLTGGRVWLLCVMLEDGFDEHHPLAGSPFTERPFYAISG
jgi:hypothetical protein